MTFGTFDRGAGVYHDERQRHKSASLVETGRHAGRSRVRFSNQETLLFHQWTKDFFISAINTSLWKLIIIICVIYIATFFFFSAFWWIIQVCDSTCLYNSAGGLTYVEIFMFSFITQQTIGYGNTGPNSCWGAAWLIIIQTLTGMIMDAITIGIVFARISHPKNRGRTIAISDSACIGRRDGILKFMFRIADLRRTQVVEPKVKAFLYTWGAGRTTAEGEHIPVRIEELDIGYIDTMLILPLIIEHTIDERSPLCGHTHDSLMAVAAEIIVTFEGTTEMGNPFMARQSYLPSEVHWGHEFKRIIVPPKPNDTRYTVDVEDFHAVEPHAAIQADHPSKTSRLVVSNALRTVPFPLLGENTLVLSDSMCFAPDENGHLSVMFRVGDTYGGNQFVDVSVRAYLYRWRPQQKSGCGMPDDFEVKLLETGYSTGEDHLFLWLPVVCKHVIDDVSPLRAWRTPGGFERDHSSAIAVVVEGWMYSNSQERMRLRIYNVKNSVRPGHGFAPMVTPPHETGELKPRIDWSKFHHLRPLTPAAARQSQRRSALHKEESFPGMDDHPLVVPHSATGMLGMATSDPGLGEQQDTHHLDDQNTHDLEQGTQNIGQGPNEHGSQEQDPSAHFRTWDSARGDASSRPPLPNTSHTGHGDTLSPAAASRINAHPPSGPSPFAGQNPAIQPSDSTPYIPYTHMYSDGPNNLGPGDASRLGAAGHSDDQFMDMGNLRPGAIPMDQARPLGTSQASHVDALQDRLPFGAQQPGRTFQGDAYRSLPNGDSQQAQQSAGDGSMRSRRMAASPMQGGLNQDGQRMNPRRSGSLTAYETLFGGDEQGGNEPGGVPDEEVMGTAIGSYSSTPEAGALSLMPFQDPTSTFRKRARGRSRVTFQETKDMWDEQNQDEEMGAAPSNLGGRGPQEAGRAQGMPESESTGVSRAQHRLARLFTSSSQNHDRDGMV